MMKAALDQARVLILLGGVAVSMSVCAAESSPSSRSPEPIPLDQLGAMATQQVEGDGLSVAATPNGAWLRCAFQRLEGEATAEGLWLRSTDEQAGNEQFRVLAVSVGRGNAQLSTFNAQRSTLHHRLGPLPDCGVRREARDERHAAFRGRSPSRKKRCRRFALPPHSKPVVCEGRVMVSDDLVRFLRPGLIEEYSVSVDGIRQDFLVLERPPGAGELCVGLTLTGAEAEEAAQGALLTLASSRRTLAYSRLLALDATGRELAARMEVLSSDRLTVRVDDANATYPIRIDPTISDADWVSMNPGLQGTDGDIHAMVVDANGHLYLAGDFTVAGTVAARHIAKWDGSAWSTLGTGIDGEVRALAAIGTEIYVGGTFTQAGGVAANSIAKWNGSGWFALGGGLQGEMPGSVDAHLVHALAVVGTDLYAGGCFTSAGGNEASRIARWDGSQWSPLGSGIDGQTVEAIAVSETDLYVGGGFTTAGGVPASNIAKWDGSSWSALGSGIDRGVGVLAVMGTHLYAGGHFKSAGGRSANNIARWNGSSWSPLGSGVTDADGTWGNSSVSAMAVSGNQLYVGGWIEKAGGVAVNHIARWNGSSWSALRGGVDETEVQALAASGGDLYVGGRFSGVDGSIVRNLAKWNGSTWSGVGPSLYTREWFSVRTLAANGSDVFAAVQHGKTTRPDNWFTIERWDGSSWSRIGSLGDEYWHHANVMAVDGANLYVGGVFTSVDGVAANAVAKWDGHTWSALGSGIAPSTEIFALALMGSDLYVGGSYFATAGGVTVNGIARWDGSNWSALGSGVDGGVYALAKSGTDLYVAGYFTEAGGVPANRIAKWGGSSWSALGSGVDGVRSLAVMGTDLYAGGVETAGGVTVNGVARWDGSAWSAVGPGVEDDDYRFPAVEALAVQGTDLYAAGAFTYVGGVPVNGVARWDGNNWSALGSGVNRPDLGSMPVNALAVDGLGRLFVGGSFTLAGNTVSPCVAQVDITGLDLAWDPIASPQGAGAPFPVTLTARNAAGEVLTSHTAPVALSGYIPVTLTTNVTLGTGTNAWDYPLNSRFHDARTQVICLADDIGPACTITSLSLEVISPPGQTLENWTIRLLYTDGDGFSSSGMWQGGPWTVVYEADEPAGATGWRTFAFDTPVEYNGQYNLLVDFSFNNSSYSFPGRCRSTLTEAYRSNVFCTDSAYGDPLDWVTDLGTQEPRPVPSQMVPNIVLGTTNPGTIPVSVSPATTGPFIDGVWTGLVTVSEAVSGVILRADDGFGHDGDSNPFNVDAATPRLALVLGADPLGHPGGAYGFDVHAPSGRAVVVEASTNLVTWNPVHTNLTGDLGQFLFYDMQTGLHPHRFFRATFFDGVLPPPQLLTGGYGARESGFGLTVGAVGGQEVVVEASTNLVVWQPILTNTAAIGPLYLCDPEMTNYSHRFYRAVAP